MERTTLNVPPSYNIVIRDLCGPPTINRQVQVSAVRMLLTRKKQHRRSENKAAKEKLT